MSEIFFGKIFIFPTVKISEMLTRTVVVCRITKFEHESHRLLFEGQIQNEDALKSIIYLNIAISSKQTYKFVTADCLSEKH